MDISYFDGLHEGEKAIIVGNGPSIQETPLEELKGYTTFGMNRINMIFDNTSWRPDYYVFQGNKKHQLFHDDALEVIKHNITTFIQMDKKDLYPNVENVVLFPRKKYKTEELRRELGVDSFLSIGDKEINYIVDNLWSIDATSGVYSYQNSMIALCQIVSYMGFDKIYFVGCDGFIEQRPHMVFKNGSDPIRHSDKYGNITLKYLNFVLSGGKPLRSFVNGILYKILQSEKTPHMIKSNFVEQNHFDEKYSKNIGRIGIKSQKQNRKLTLVHRIIEQAGDQYGFETYNATINGNIDIHTSIDIEDLISGEHSGI